MAKTTIAALEERVAILEARIAALEPAPATQPALVPVKDRGVRIRLYWNLAPAQAFARTMAAGGRDVKISGPVKGRYEVRTGPPGSIRPKTPSVDADVPV